MRHITKKIHTGYHMLSCASLSSVQQIHEPGLQVQCPKRSLHPGKTLPSPAASEDRSMSSSHGQGLPELPRGTGVKWDQVLWLCLMPKADRSHHSYLNPENGFLSHWEKHFNALLWPTGPCRTTSQLQPSISLPLTLPHVFYLGSSYTVMSLFCLRAFAHTLPAACSASATLP